MEVLQGKSYSAELLNNLLSVAKQTRIRENQKMKCCEVVFKRTNSYIKKFLTTNSWSANRRKKIENKQERYFPCCRISEHLIIERL